MNWQGRWVLQRMSILSTVALAVACSQQTSQERQADTTEKETTMGDKVVRDDAYWKQKLTPEQYHVLREKGTEPAGSGEYVNAKQSGTYTCAACGKALFSSDTKFDSGTGWPSFWQPAGEDCVRTEADNSLFSRRTEVLCDGCGSHLGHVFGDGPQPTGQRYCINSLSLKLAPKEDAP